MEILPPSNMYLVYENFYKQHDEILICDTENSIEYLGTYDITLDTSLSKYYVKLNFEIYKNFKTKTI